MRRADLRAAADIVLAALIGGTLVCIALPGFWVYLATSVVITGVALQSLGLVVGRTGMISLCQMSFAGVGAWVVGWLNTVDAPGGLVAWIVVGGLAAVPFGVVIGLPALRLRGINLAIVTLGFASAFDAVLASITFPGQTDFLSVARPALFDSDTGYFVFALAVFTLLAVVLNGLGRARLGSAWVSVRHSERAAAANGVVVPGAKLSAFAISAFVAGVSGGLLAGMLGTLVSDNFNMMQSLVLFAIATMAGAQHATGAIIGGALTALFPQALRSLGLPQDLGNILFALGAAQALASGSSSAEVVHGVLARLRRRGKEGAQADRGPAAAMPAPRDPVACPLEVRALTVRYGAVHALSDVTLMVPQAAVVGLIGPNGAGKSTFIDAVSGFLSRYEGVVSFAGVTVDGWSAHRRARAGVRRTWQTTRIAPDLTVGAYVRLAGPEASDADVRAILDWVGCPDADSPVASVDAGTRRLLDIAGVVAARPALVLLDEPAAGQSYDETLRLGRRIAEIPKLFGASVLLVEHDMDLVRTACSAVTVLDFGRVIAAGPTGAVLADPVVRKAYLGIDDEALAS